MKLILLSGWAGSGKDSVADYLRERGYGKLSFADALKAQVAQQYNIPLDWFYDRYLKETPLLQYPVVSTDGFSEHVNTFMASEHATCRAQKYHTPRSLCILEGSVKRSVEPDYWVKKTFESLHRGSNYVVADWRYRSEYEALKHLAPITIRINRFETTQSTDPSERDLDTFVAYDHIIKNDSTLENLFEKIRLVLGL
jgi:hypothetical protein